LIITEARGTNIQDVYVAFVLKGIIIEGMKNSKLVSKNKAELTIALTPQNVEKSPLVQKAENIF
jgi:hypothetical protein